MIRFPYTFVLMIIIHWRPTCGEEKISLKAPSRASVLISGSDEFGARLICCDTFRRWPWHLRKLPGNSGKTPTTPPSLHHNHNDSQRARLRAPLVASQQSQGTHPGTQLSQIVQGLACKKIIDERAEWNIAIVRKILSDNQTDAKLTAQADCQASHCSIRKIQAKIPDPGSVA